jgi:hypothetical protein
MSEHVRAPFSMEAAFALNSYQFGAQSWGHPYTCPEDHAESVRLVAMPDGWHCPVDTCDYRQPWAHASHAGAVPYGPVACEHCRGQKQPDPDRCTCARYCGSDFCGQQTDAHRHAERWNIDTAGAVDERGYVSKTDEDGWALP